MCVCVWARARRVVEQRATIKGKISDPPTHNLIDQLPRAINGIRQDNRNEAARTKVSSTAPQSPKVCKQHQKMNIRVMSITT